MMPAKIRLALALFLLAAVSGCGYTLTGTGSTLPDHVKSLAIPVFVNNSKEPDIQRDLTESIREAFINDGRLKVADAKQADLLMVGKLFHYKLRAVSFTSRDVVAEYYVELGVDVLVKERGKLEPYMQQKFKTKWDYKTSSNVVNTESARQEALEEAYRDLANRLVSLLIEKF